MQHRCCTLSLIVGASVIFWTRDRARSWLTFRLSLRSCQQALYQVGFPWKIPSGLMLTCPEYKAQALLHTICMIVDPILNRHEESSRITHDDCTFTTLQLLFGTVSALSISLCFFFSFSTDATQMRNVRWYIWNIVRMIFSWIPYLFDTIEKNTESIPWRGGKNQWKSSWKLQVIILIVVIFGIIISFSVSVSIPQAP